MALACYPKMGLGSHGGTSDPRIWWKVSHCYQLITSFTCARSDPITITCSAMTDGFALLFEWATVTHYDVVSLLDVVATAQDKDMRWQATPLFLIRQLGLL